MSTIKEIKDCNYKFLSKHIMDQVIIDLNIPAKAVQDILQKKWEVNVSHMKAFRAKSRAKKLMRGDHNGHYSLLRDYVLELTTQNPRTTVKCQVKLHVDHNAPTIVFKRIYVCLGALKQGFKASGRELLGLHGAFISGSFPSQVLIVVCINANNGISLLIYVIVEDECKDSWV